MTGNDKSLKAGETELKPPSTEPNSQGDERSSGSRRTPPAEMTEAEKADAVAALMAGEMGFEPEDDDTGAGEGERTSGPADGGDTTGDGDTPPAPRKTASLADIAEALDVEISDLYKIELKAGDGSTATLQQIKDAWDGRQDAERVTAERTAELDGREAKIIADQQIWSLLAASGQLPQKAIQTAVEQLQTIVERESDMLLTLVPDLQDATKMDGFRRDMVEAYSEVGYKPHEIMLTDHRQALFVRRFMQMKREIASLRKQLQPAPQKGAKPQGRGRTNNQSARFRNAARGTESDKIAAVTSLLRGA